VARILKRPLIRLPLGGADDVSLIGADPAYHRSHPGAIVRGLASAGTRNVVIVLDEIDKAADRTNHGSVPVLLSLLDPEQRPAFRDAYLADVPIDLSAAVMIATANGLEAIRPELLDRLDVIQLPAYSLAERQHIASQYQLPRLRSELAVSSDVVDIPSEILLAIVGSGASRSGMRQIDRRLRTVMARALALHLAGRHPVTVTEAMVTGWVNSDETFESRIGFRVRPLT